MYKTLCSGCAAAILQTFIQKIQQNYNSALFLADLLFPEQLNFIMLASNTVEILAEGMKTFLDRLVASATSRELGS